MKKTIKILSSIKHFMFKGYQDLLFADEDKKEDLNEYISRWQKYLEIIAEIFEFDISIQEVLTKIDRDKFISSYIKNYIEEDKFGEVIFERFGLEMNLLYKLYTQTLALKYTISFIRKVDELEIGKNNRIYEEYDFAKNYLKTFAEFLSGGEFLKLKYFNQKELRTHEKIIQAINSNKSIKKIDKISDSFINELMVDQLEINFNLRISQMLIEKLEKCPLGNKGWQEYEDITFSIIKFLFSPQFEYIFKQVRTSDGHQIRDLVLPNYQEKGFFKNIKDEFQSKNIVIEAKNGSSKALNKNSLNQLRIYLSKKSIGRFGMLFIRNKPSKSIKLAQRLAYSDDNIMILILDDEKLKHLIYSKALLGSAEFYLYRLKTEFDLNF